MMYVIVESQVPLSLWLCPFVLFVFRCTKCLRSERDGCVSSSELSSTMSSGQQLIYWRLMGGNGCIYWCAVYPSPISTLCSAKILGYKVTNSFWDIQVRCREPPLITNRYDILNQLGKIFPFPKFASFQNHAYLIEIGSANEKLYMLLKWIDYFIRNLWLDM